MTMLRVPVMVALVISAIVMVGCAKRPATTQASAPAPLGAAGVGARIAGDAGQSGAASTDDKTGGAEGASSAQGGEAVGGSDAGSAQAGAGASGDRGNAAASGATTGAGGQRAIAGRDGAEAGGSTRSGDGAGRDNAAGGRDSGGASGRAGVAGDGSDGRASASSGQGPSEGTGQIASAPGGDRAGQGEGASGVMVAAARPEVREFVSVSELGDVHFDFDRYDIRPEDARVLDANAEWLKANPERVLLIEGHCDERGTNEYNLALGEHRAKSAMNYLISQGVQSSRMTIISYGEERPACTDKNESCWAANRRAHFLVKSR